MPAERPARSKKLGRQISRYLGEDDAENALARLDALFTAIDKSYAEYDDKLKFTMRNLELSSEELNASNRTLERLNAGINAMLDSLAQGLVFFDASGVCSPVFSKAAPSLLGVSPGNMHIADVLRLDEEERQNIDLWLSIVFNTTTAMSFSELKDLAPRRLDDASGRIIELDYRPLYIVDDVMSGVMMIAIDKTDEYMVNARLDATRDEARKIQSIARRRNEFWRFISNIRAFLGMMRGDLRRDLGDEDVLRELHTLKGLAALFGLTAMADMFQAAEGDLKSQGLDALSADRLDLIEREVDDALHLATDLFGDSFVSEGQVRTVEYGKMVAFSRLLHKLPNETEGKAALIDFFNQEFMAVEVSDCFSTFRFELLRLAEAQGKPAPRIQFIHGDLKIVATPYTMFFDALVHLARNIMDHGIEPPSQRREKGKPDYGTVTISAAREVIDGRPWYVFGVGEDGRGFDIHNIKARLLERGDDRITDLSDHDVIQRIFDPGFSTVREATALSGRGVGMAVIKSAVEMLGGSVQAERAENGENLFLFRFPERV